MKKNILIIFSFLLSVHSFAQTESPVSTPATADVPAVVIDTIQSVQASAMEKHYRFGYLSYNTVMKMMPEYKEAQSSIEKLKTYYDEEMVRAEQEFSKKFSEYIDGYRSFPENIMLKRQKELQQLMEESIAFKNEAQKILSKSEEELLEPIHAKLKNAIKTVGTRNGYSYILNTDGNTYPFINTNEGQGEDITEYVMLLMK